jgi:hypothetical protein
MEKEHYEGFLEHGAQDLQSKEYVFCVSNEKIILSAVNEVICYYNYSLSTPKSKETKYMHEVIQSN